MGIVGYNQDVGDVGLHDHLARPQASIPLRRLPRTAQERLNLRKTRLRLRRIQLIRVRPAHGGLRPFLGNHVTARLRPELRQLEPVAEIR